ncbi:hydroxymethylglutaryl-CoA synthase [Paraburkholderia caribensis]|nr:hydroxymethylglutaryl-CoA synthase [Paraburkholderia caribensis]
MKVGIDDISLYVPGFYFPLTELAKQHGIDADKYLIGIGQEKMAVPSPDEDIVSMAANAAAPLLNSAVVNSISTVILATESGIDQSKSAGMFVHGVLGLASNCRVIEIKQACYGATAGIQMAYAMIHQRPHERVLVIATDVARYQQNSEGECTQGAGAIAMIISSAPRILEIHPHQGRHSVDVMDFWRPNQHKAALVDGKLSIDVYLDSLKQSWKNYRKDGGRPLVALQHLCFHQPFTKMAKKAFSVFETIEPDAAAKIGARSYQLSQIYGREIGNCYTASLYIALLSLLDNSEEDLSNHHVGLFSYGSGSVGEFFSGTIVEGYTKHSRKGAHAAMLKYRSALSYETYQNWFYQDVAADVASYRVPTLTSGQYRFSGSEGFRRLYAPSLHLQKKAG